MSTALVPRVRFTRALASRPFALLWLGQLISSLGNGAYLTALAWEVLLLTRSATAMGLVVIASSLPTLLFLLIGGVAADRLDRRLVMLASDAGRAAVVLLIALLAALGALQLWHLVVFSLVFGVVQGFFRPAYQAIIPQLVEVEALPSANGLTGIGANVGQLMGPLLGAGCVALAGPALAFAFDGLTFLASAACLLGVLARPIAQAGEAAAAPSTAVDRPARRRGLRGVLEDAREGLRYITGSTWLTVTIVLPALGNIGWTGAFVVALPKLVAVTYGQGVWLLGAIAAANAAGSILGLVVIAQAHLRRRGRLAFLINIVASVALAAFGLPLPHAAAPIVTCAAGAVMGFGLEAFNTIWLSTVQELVPGEKLGRVFALDALGSQCLLPAGYALSGVVTDALGAAWVFLGGGLLNLALSGVALSIRDVRELE